MLALLSAAELLGMSPWFAASAVAPELTRMWSLSPSEAGWLTSAVQLGFVAGTLTAAILNLADVWSSRWYFAGSAMLAAIANALLPASGDFAAALPLRFLTGFFLAGVYPPAMKMAATWFRSARGLAIGAIVGALTVGKASPYLVEAVGGATLGQAVGSTSAAAVAAAILIAVGYRDGPHAFPQRPFSWRLAGTVAKVRELRLVTGGYLGHMWELYAYWTWLAAFLAAGGVGPATAVAFAGIAIGLVGCLWGGWAADRLGRERVVIWALAASGTCAILAGLLHDRGVWLLAPLVLVWGVAVIADSAQFSALVTEVVPSHAVGTALTLQTSLGFLLTMVSIQMVPVAVAAWGWQWAFPLLAAGPSLGIIAMRRLQALRRGAG